MSSPAPSSPTPAPPGTPDFRVTAAHTGGAVRAKTRLDEKKLAERRAAGTTVYEFGRHRQLVASGQLNLGDRQLIEIYCQLTLQISAQISNFWVLAALCSAAVT
jgi:hypothetical protein